MFIRISEYLSQRVMKSIKIKKINIYYIRFEKKMKINRSRIFFRAAKHSLLYNVQLLAPATTCLKKSSFSSSQQKKKSLFLFLLSF